MKQVVLQEKRRSTSTTEAAIGIAESLRTVLTAEKRHYSTLLWFVELLMRFWIFLNMKIVYLHGFSLQSSLRTVFQTVSSRVHLNSARNIYFWCSSQNQTTRIKIFIEHNFERTSCNESAWFECYYHYISLCSWSIFFPRWGQFFGNFI